MSLFLDNIIFSLQKSGGISAYWAEICRRLMDDQYFMCSFFEHKSALQNIFRQQLKISQDKFIKKRIYPVNIERYRTLQNDIEGVFHSSYYRTINSTKKMKQVVTVHDFIYEKFVSGIKKKVHIWQKLKAIAHSDVILCVSENTKKDLCEIYPQYKNKDIRVVYNGVSEEYCPLVNKDISKTPYILWVGSRAKYKNFDFAVKWISLLNDFELWIVGAELLPEEKKMLIQLLPNRFTFIGSVNNDRLNKLYNNASCFVYPSSYEGFGIPVIEAMRAGCPVITLNTSSLPEVCGSAGLMAKNLDTGIFTELLNYAINYRQQISSSGIIQADKFSWNKCYKETTSVYKALFR
ncbi:MAG: glycosyltransferase family 4 protein [Bacteroidales bacterium]|jgi:mannosyltransferase|nr:glycosyltransferase family 4 protein [Bacteroidales bacterium]